MTPGLSKVGYMYYTQGNKGTNFELIKNYDTKTDYTGGLLNNTDVWLFLCLVQVRLRTEVPHTPSSARLGLELMTSRS